MAGPRSLYDVLNVAPEAEPVVIDAAYKALIKKYHPDQAAGEPASRDAAAINEAFATLKDPARRADYDHRLWTKQQAARLAELRVNDIGSRPRFSALSGWLVAGLLACALAAVAFGKSLAPPPLTALAEAAETFDSEAPARAAAAKAAAAEAVHDRVVMPSSAAVIAQVDAQHRARAVRVRAPGRSASPPVRYRRARPAPAAGGKREPRREGDLGYIY